MLSRQSQIFLTNSDLRDLEVLLRKRGDTQFLSEIPNKTNDALLPLDTLEMAPDEGQHQSPICYLAPAGQTRNVVLEVVSPVKTSVDDDKSNLIRLWRSRVSEGRIGHGSFYYTPVYSAMNGELYDKDPAFVSWAQRVMAAIRRSLTYNKALMAYLGADAQSRVASGELKLSRWGQLVPTPEGL